MSNRIPCMGPTRLVVKGLKGKGHPKLTFKPAHIVYPVIDLGEVTARVLDAEGALHELPIEDCLFDLQIVMAMPEQIPMIPAKGGSGGILDLHKLRQPS